MTIITATLKKQVKSHATEIIAAKKDYFSAKTLEETIKRKAEEIQCKILEVGNYQICDEIWCKFIDDEPAIVKRITSPSATFLMSKEDFDTFLEECYKEYLKAGIADKRGKEYIPEAEASDARERAEDVLLKLAIEILPDNLKRKYGKTLKNATKHWKYREQLLNLILRLDV